MRTWDYEWYTVDPIECNRVKVTCRVYSADVRGGWDPDNPSLAIEDFREVEVTVEKMWLHRPNIVQQDISEGYEDMSPTETNLWDEWIEAQMDHALDEEDAFDERPY